MCRIVSALAVVGALFSSNIAVATERFVQAKKYLKFDSGKKSATVQRDYPDFPQILSYNEMMKLAPYKRDEYIRGLRAILVELSLEAKAGRGTLVADGGIEALMHPDDFVAKENRYFALLAMFDSMMPSAHADYVAYPNSYGGISGRECTVRGEGEERIPVAPDKYVCVSRRALDDARTARRGQNPITTVVEGYRRTNAPQPTPASETVAPSATAVPAEAPRPTPIVPMRPVPAPSEAVPRAEPARITVRPAETAAERPAVVSLKPAEPAPVCGKVIVACEEKAKELKKGEKADPESYAAKRKAYLQEFRKSAKEAKAFGCISSGNMSRYANNEVKPGGCSLVTKFCLNQEKCDEGHAAGKTRQAREGGGDKEVDKDEGGEYECKGKDKGKAVCSPIVFGLKTEKDPICVKASGRTLTIDCDEETKKLEGTPEYKKFLDVNKNGVANAWDDWRDQFNELCANNSASQAAHCEECARMGARLVKLGYAVKGECTNAKAYRDIRKKEDGPADAAR